MFGRRSDSSAEPKLDVSGQGAETDTTGGEQTGAGDAAKAQANLVPEVPRRAPLDLPGSGTRRPNLNVNRGGVESKRLTVGQEISLSGEITACETLVVEGSVEATLENSRLLEISETGVFRGKVTINEAVVAGVFEGNLQVRDRLTVKSTGRVSGTVAFGQLEVELGGRIMGSIDVYQEAPEASDSDPA